jgi:hypothetical protein
MKQQLVRRASAVAALALIYACAGHSSSRMDGGPSADDDAMRGEADADAEHEIADATSPLEDGGAVRDAGAANDAVVASDAALEAGSAVGKLQIAAPGRSRISVWSRRVCALNEQRDLVCWGALNASPKQSATPLHGPFLSTELCSGHSGVVCALGENGVLNCADWLGAVSALLNNPQECTPPVSASAFSCGSFGDAEITVLDPAGALSRLGFGCASTPEGRDAPYERVEMVYHSLCAIDRAQKVHCFSDGPAPDAGLRPEEPVIEDRYIDLALNEINTCAVTTDGRVRCWDYQGVDTTGPDSFAASAAKIGKVARLASSPSGGEVLCALFENGTVGCSSGFSRSALRTVRQDKPWIEIAVDGRTLCGVQSDRSIVCRPLDINCSDASCTSLAEAVAPPDGLRVPE